MSNMVIEIDKDLAEFICTMSDNGISKNDKETVCLIKHIKSRLKMSEFKVIM